MLRDRQEYHGDKAKSFLFVALSLILFSNFFPLAIHRVIGLIPYAAGIKFFSIKPRIVLGSIVCSFLLVLLQIFAPVVNPTYFSLLNRFFYPQQMVKDWISSRYSPDTSAFINLLVFNVKNPDIYKNFADFGIAHLISISGLHFSLISLILRKVLRNKGIVLVLLFVYGSFVGYSIAALRAILFIAFDIKNKYKKGSLISIASLLFNIHIYQSISFILSYFFPLIFIINRNLVKNRVNLYLMNMGTSFIFSTLALLSFNKRIIVLQSLNTIIFQPLVCFVFVYFFFFGSITSLSSIHEFISKLMINLKNFFPMNSSSIYLDFGNESLSSIFLAFFVISLIIFKYQKSPRKKG